MLQLIRKTPKVDWIGLAPYAFLFSGVLLIASFYIWFSLGDDKYGIDYVGGHEIVVKIQDDTNSEAVANLLQEHGFDDPLVQSFEVGTNDYAIRVAGDHNEATSVVRQRVQQALQSRFSGEVEVLKSDFVGPTLGDELKRKALWAVTLGMIGITAYITIRFQGAFAVGALVALFHDVIIATGMYLWVGHELNAAALAAALTIVGYSVNDTIVIFDKVREEMRKRGADRLRELLNDANNAMLNRTIITSLLTLFSAVALLVLGGGAIQDLSVYLVIGLVSGVYSTIFIAGPVVLVWHRWRGAKSAPAPQAA